MPAGKVLRIELDAPAVVHWEVGGRGMPTRDSGLGVHFADLPTAGLAPGDEVRFVIARTGSDRIRHPIAAIRPEVVRIEGGDHHVDTERRRQPAAARTAANGAVTIR